MKAIACEQPNQLKLMNIDEPVLSEGEALVRIHRVGICGTDLHAYRGVQPFFTYPRILGHELAGIVEDMGTNRDPEIQQGDQVCIIPYMHCGTCIACRQGRTNCCVSMQVLGVHKDGGMREKIAVPLTHILRTEGLTMDQTALVEPLSIGAHAVRRAQPNPDDTVLVIGAGPIGLAVMAFCKLLGLRVIAMDVNKERLNLCPTAMQVDETVNALEDPLQRLKELTNGELASVVFDATGNAKSMNQAFAYAAHGGKVVYVGLVKSDITFHHPEFHKRELTLLSSRNATREDFEHVIHSLRSGAIRLDGYMTHTLAFEDIIDEFDALLLPESQVIKAIVQL